VIVRILYPPQKVLIIVNNTRPQIPGSEKFPNDGPLAYLVEGGDLKGFARHQDQGATRFITL
jgi:hypothetical protein